MYSITHPLGNSLNQRLKSLPSGTCNTPLSGKPENPLIYLL